MDAARRAYPRAALPVNRTAQAPAATRPAHGFAMVYATKRGATRALGASAAALADAGTLVLATDREDEAIALQVLEWLREKGALDGKAVRRVEGG